MADPLTIFVVYDHPIDHPAQIIVRRWIVANGMVTPGPIVANRRTLEEARATVTLLAPGAVRLEPHVFDDPVIVEVWL